MKLVLCELIRGCVSYRALALRSIETTGIATTDQYCSAIAPRMWWLILGGAFQCLKQGHFAVLWYVTHR